MSETNLIGSIPTLIIVSLMMIFVVAGIAAMIVLFRTHAVVDEEKDHSDYD